MLIEAMSLFAAMSAQDLEQCAQIDNNRERLACYDALAGRTTAETASSAPVEVMAEGDEAVDRFGLPALRENEPDKFTARVTGASLSRTGAITFELENGQVWVQLGADTTRLPAHRLSDIETATVEKRQFGGFRLSVSPQDKSFLVRRVK